MTTLTTIDEVIEGGGRAVHVTSNELFGSGGYLVTILADDLDQDAAALRGAHEREFRTSPGRRVDGEIVDAITTRQAIENARAYADALCAELGLPLVDSITLVPRA